MPYSVRVYEILSGGDGDFGSDSSASTPGREHGATLTYHDNCRLYDP